MRGMRRTQIYLEPDLSGALDSLARRHGTSRSEIIRLAARRFVEQEQASDEDGVLGLIGIGDAGPGQTSQEHDTVLAEESLRSRSP
jgi:predicted transcriptional regulator